LLHVVFLPAFGVYLPDGRAYGLAHPARLPIARTPDLANSARGAGAGVEAQTLIRFIQLAFFLFW